MPLKWISHRRKELALVFCSLIFAIGIVELFLRFSGLSYPVFHRLEQPRGWAPTPNVAGTWITEGRSFVSINGEGFRDRDHAIEKPADTFRIAVLGDSMSEAFAVELERTYWSVLGQALRSCAQYANKNVEVLNFSVSGYGTAQQLITLRQNALKYEPDIVLLGFFAANDVWNNHKPLDGHEDRVYFQLRDGKLRLDDTNVQSTRFKLKAWRRNFGNALVNASYTLQLAREFYYRTKSAKKAARQNEDHVFDIRDAGYKIFSPPTAEEWRQAWAVTENLIHAIKTESESRNAHFWLVNLTAPAQVYPDERVRKSFADALDVADLDYPERRLGQLADAGKMFATNLVPALRDFADSSGRYLHGFENTRLGTGHWNENGHRAAGIALAKALCNHRF